MAPSRLSEEEIAGRLVGSAWQRDGDEIVRTVRVGDFPQAVAFVVRVAFAAEAANHHPDIAIAYNRVTFRLTTHDAGGLSALDFELAGVVDALADAGSS